MDSQMTSCNCVACPGTGCTCGCQAPQGAQPCLCGPSCGCDGAQSGCACG